MRIGRLVLCLASVCIPSTASGQATPAVPKEHLTQPSPQALELSRILSLRQYFFISRPTLDEMKLRTTQRLLSTQLATKGPGCNPATAECRAIAEKIAAEHAAADVQSINDSIDRIYARFIEEKMTPSQIRKALEFMRSDAGQAFAASVRGPDPREDKNILLTIASSFQVSAPFEKFYEEAKHLPRYYPPVPPPPSWPRSPKRP